MSLSNQYQINKRIGQGSYATIYLANRISDKALVVIKRISKSESDKTGSSVVGRMQVASEYSILMKIQHPNIVRIFDSIEDDNFFYIVLEYCQGINLLEYLNQLKAPLTNEEVLIIFQQLTCAIYHLHISHLAHRDIKLENIMINVETKIVKIIDFGFGVECNDEYCLRQTVCGSYHYLAPEIISQQTYDAQRADLWSLGIVLYLLCFRKMPWKSKNTMGISNEILNSEIEIPEFRPEQFRSLISGLLNKDPNKRLLIQQVCDTLHMPHDRNHHISLQKKMNSQLNVYSAKLPPLSNHSFGTGNNKISQPNGLTLNIKTTLIRRHSLTKNRENSKSVF